MALKTIRVSLMLTILVG